LKKAQRETLKKLADMGATNAASALSMMMQEPVTISVPHQDVYPLTRIYQQLEGEQEVVGIYSKLSGDMTATIMIIFKKDHAGNLVRVLLGDAVGRISAMEEMTISAIQETGNHMISAFSNALADYLGIRVIPSPPGVGVDMAGALVDYTIIELGMAGEVAYFFHTDLLIEPGALMGHLFLFMDSESMEKLIEKLDRVKR